MEVVCRVNHLDKGPVAYSVVHAIEDESIPSWNELAAHDLYPNVGCLILTGEHSQKVREHLEDKADALALVVDYQITGHVAHAGLSLADVVLKPDIL
jgi:hypothetical protein